MRIIKRNIVAALIISSDQQIFLGKKDAHQGGVYPDCWHIPGGGIEEKETQIQALEREVLEETGIDITPYPVKLIDNTGTGNSEKILKQNREKVLCQMHFFVYQINILNQKAAEIKVKLNSDLAEFRWIAPRQLKKVKLTPPSVTLFKKIGFL